MSSSRDPEARRAYDREYYAKNGHKYAHRHRIWRVSNPGRARFLAYRKRAQQRNLPFTLQQEDFVIQETLCPLCGILLTNPDSGMVQPNTPSMDRIVPSLGYVKENVWHICYACNSKKNGAEPDLMLRSLQEAARRGLWVPPTGVVL